MKLFEKRKMIKKRAEYYKTLNSILQDASFEKNHVNYLSFAIDVLGKEMIASNQMYVFLTGKQD